MNAFWGGFEKTALNAQKAREVAKQFGLVPEFNWKWALRNLRKGKTRQSLGMAPDKMIDAARRLGSEVEAGAYWGKGAKGSISQLGKGTPTGYHFAKADQKLMRNDRFKAEVGNLIAAPGDRERLKVTGRLANIWKKEQAPYKKMNTLHTHPASGMEHVKHEANLIPHLRKGYRAMKEDKVQMMKSMGMSDETMKSLGMFPASNAPHRMDRLGEASTKAQLESYERRHSSKKLELMPSGTYTRNPYNPQNSADLGQFLHFHDIGTHHNIVSPGSGVGVHSLRPDKTHPSGKRLRTVLFDEKKST